jgi:hypothetical protein
VSPPSLSYLAGLRGDDRLQAWRWTLAAWAWT